MRIISLQKNREIDLANGAGLCLGHFDGVHRGHLALIDELKRRNKELDKPLPLGVFLFSTPPTATLNKAPTPQLTTLDEKLDLMAKAGLDFAVLYDFPAIKDMSPADFVNKVLLAECHAKILVCGFNYTFGAKGAGTPADLGKLFATQKGNLLSVMPPVMDGPYTVSSSLVRAMLLGGHPDDATRLLGRPYTLKGQVGEGRQVGRTMGLPTANLLFPTGALVPMHGVYAVTVRVGKRTYTGICNVGVRPTIAENGLVNCETFIFDFDGDLYGKVVEVSFLYFIREERKFDGLSELEAQIRLDIERAKKYF